MKHALVLAILLGLACTSTAFAGPSARYRCTDGTRLTAAFDNSGSGSVTLTFARKTPPLTLPQAMSADGGRYSDQGTEFWIKGQAATFTRGGKTVNCKVY